MHGRITRLTDILPGLLSLTPDELLLQALKLPDVAVQGPGTTIKRDWIMDMEVQS